MKYIKKFNESFDSGNDSSMEDLNKFYKKFMNDIKDRHKLELNFNFIEKNLDTIKEALDLYLFTPQFRAGVYEKYKVEVPKITYLRKKFGGASEWHHINRWSIRDKLIGGENFLVEIEMMIPKDKQFQDENTIVSISLYIKPANRRKEFFELYNMGVYRNQSDDNFIKFFDMLEKFGKDMNEIFKIPVKLSKKKF